ncbi:uncharacterized protein [Penaeus vannamei]|uniref:uncharacterized protein isoform X1 n=1 Tax=Penaeus vannamei TaxID=6689 RepID=UPI00387F5D81
MPVICESTLGSPIVSERFSNRINRSCREMNMMPICEWLGLGISHSTIGLQSLQVDYFSYVLHSKDNKDMVQYGIGYVIHILTGVETSVELKFYIDLVSVLFVTMDILCCDILSLILLLNLPLCARNVARRIKRRSARLQDHHVITALHSTQQCHRKPLATYGCISGFLVSRNSAVKGGRFRLIRCIYPALLYLRPGLSSSQFPFRFISLSHKEERDRDGRYRDRCLDYLA